MRVGTIVGCVLVVAVAAAPARAAALQATESETAAARQHYAQGSRLYDLAEYEPALHEFREAYRIVGDPAFLFNIAQCHRKLGHTQDAISFYRTYLRRAPNAANRGEVERRIAELERPQPEAPAESPRPAPVAATAAAPPAAVVTPPPQPAAAAPQVMLAAAPAAAPPAEERPFYKRGWFWIAAGVVVVGAATTAILLGSGEPAAFCPDCAGTGVISPR